MCGPPAPPCRGCSGGSPSAPRSRRSQRPLRAGPITRTPSRPDGERRSGVCSGNERARSTRPVGRRRPSGPHDEHRHRGGDRPTPFDRRPIEEAGHGPGRHHGRSSAGGLDPDASARRTRPPRGSRTRARAVGDRDPRGTHPRIDDRRPAPGHPRSDGGLGGRLRLVGPVRPGLQQPLQRRAVGGCRGPCLVPPRRGVRETGRVRHRRGAGRARSGPRRRVLRGMASPHPTSGDR